MSLSVTFSLSDYFKGTTNFGISTYTYAFSLNISCISSTLSPAPYQALSYSNNSNNNSNETTLNTTVPNSKYSTTSQNFVLYDNTSNTSLDALPYYGTNGIMVMSFAIPYFSQPNNSYFSQNGTYNMSLYRLQGTQTISNGMLLCQFTININVDGTVTISNN